MVIRYIEVTVLVLLALISDIKTYKIKNILVFSFVILGLLTNLLTGGVEGLLSSLLGMIAPLVLLVLYMLRMLGAADIKLFSAIGSVMGVKFVLYTMTYSFLGGGVIALGVLIVRRNGRQRLSYLLQYIKSCILSRSLLPYTDFEDKSDGAKLRFAYAIVCGTLIELFIRIFASGNG